MATDAKFCRTHVRFTDWNAVRCPYADEWLRLAQPCEATLDACDIVTARRVGLNPDTGEMLP
jgi:hypothetical protein